MLRVKPSIQKIGSIISASVNSEDGAHYSVETETPYVVDENIDKSEVYTEDRYHVRTTIELPIKFCNPIINGRDMSAISKIFKCCKGIPVSTTKHLANGNTLLLIEGGEYSIIEPSEVDVHIPISSYKIGGDAIEYILNSITNNDIVTSIKNLLIRAISCCCGVSIKSDDIPSVLPLITSNTGVHLYNNFYYNDVNNVLVSNDIVESYQDDIYRYLVANSDTGDFLPDIVVLELFKNDKTPFLNSLQKYIYPLPIGFRESISSMRHPLTVKYNNLYSYVDELKSACYQSRDIMTIRDAFMSVNNCIFELFVSKGPYDSEQYKSLMETLKGKKGVIRDKLQAGRIDYSGRAVITVDYNMPVDCIGIPISEAVKLCEYELAKSFAEEGIVDVAKVLKSPEYKHIREDRAKDIMEGTYIAVGRQPTLYRLGIQAFKVKIVSGLSIVINPLVCPIFNADFDGDKMHVNYPQTPEAKREVASIMANMNNIFYPKDGSCNLSPRMEMIYGLYLAYNAKPSGDTVTYENAEVFKKNIIQDLELQNVSINQPCVVGGNLYETTGYAVLKISLGPQKDKNILLGVTPITHDSDLSRAKEMCVSEDWYKEFFTYLNSHRKASLVSTIDFIVRVAFTVANLYPPSISMLTEVDTSFIKNEFFSSIKHQKELHDIGLETDESFSLYYQKELSKLNSSIKKEVIEEMESGDFRGFLDLVKSKARGKESNLIQMFGMKGNIAKNKAESFTTIIEHSLSDQLTGLEHFISAYGSRDGIIDKVSETSDPGYISRQMSHVARVTSITSIDCGTTEGLPLTYDTICDMIGRDKLTGVEAADINTVKDYFSKIVVGRYIVGNSSNYVENKKIANDIFDANIATHSTGLSVTKGKGIKIRSTLTCKNPCCAKCYGIDLNTHAEVKVGTPVGFIASQAIAEPITQLIMKNFQQGGVAGVKNMTSSFDVFNDTLNLLPSAKNYKSTRDAITWDMISPVTGVVSKVPYCRGLSRVIIKNSSGKNLLTKTVLVGSHVKLKNNVSKGETIREVPGSLDVKEVLAYRGVDAARDFIISKVFNLYIDNGDFVDIRHFEVLVAGMLFYICVKGNDYFKPGHYYSLHEYRVKDTKDCKFVKVIRGLKQVPKVRDDFLSAIYFEDIGRTLTRSVYVSNEDSLKDPFVRATFGMPLGIGSDVVGYC